jgi:hypothetical protein
LCAGDVEQPVLAKFGTVRGRSAARGFVHRRQRTEGHPAHASCDLGAENGIDDPPGVNGRAQRAIVARSGEREDAGAFHEERPLLTEEDGEALIHFHLEGIAFDLAEVGIDRRVERDGGGEADFGTDAHVGATVGAAPDGWRLAQLVASVGRAREDVAGEPRLEIVESHRRVAFEDPHSR